MVLRRLLMGLLSERIDQITNSYSVQEDS